MHEAFTSPGGLGDTHFARGTPVEKCVNIGPKAGEIRPILAEKKAPDVLQLGSMRRYKGTVSRITGLSFGLFLQKNRAQGEGGR